MRIFTNFNFLFFCLLLLNGCQTTALYNDKGPAKPSELGSLSLCNIATRNGEWETRPEWVRYAQEARRRGLNCGVNTSHEAQTAFKTTPSAGIVTPNINTVSNKQLCQQATFKGGWSTQPRKKQYVQKAKRLGLDCNAVVNQNSNPETQSAQLTNSRRFNTEETIFSDYSDLAVCLNVSESLVAQREAQLRNLNCQNDGSISTNQNTSPAPTVSTSQLTAAQKEADRLRNELAALKAEQEQQQQTINSDTRVPLIDQLAANTSGKQGIISGRVRDNTGIAELTVDGMVVQVQPDGRFEHRTFVPADGKQVLIEATDLAGLTSQKQLSLYRDAAIQSASISFDSLNPLGKRAAKNRDALALIVGVETYEQTPAQAIYADSDAKMFRDYATEKLGIPDNRIETLINDGAELTDMLRSIKNWLARSVKQDKTDVYVFFAGHGLASDDGEKMYLLPYDGAPQFLDRTAILRDELFSDIAAANPRSVTVFLDTCYSGTTRGTDMLVASRPIAIRAKQQNIPDGFTVFTAAGGDQTAKPLEEAKHGMFSYFLMKGMEGDADSNNDNQITAAELHQYVEQNVVQQSGGSQVPELQGDANRVLVRFQ
ncbi:hypothetical protein HIMB100_00019370 [SAR116 cluster alpha proteobacterium HIMB100]|nr:hypothetical protein HIMB100_00019370 [SAR116 cluster alpha proteobacterium HIMB100]